MTQHTHRVPAFATVHPFVSSSAGMIGGTARGRYGLRDPHRVELLAPSPTTHCRGRRDSVLLKLLASM